MVISTLTTFRCPSAVPVHMAPALTLAAFDDPRLANIFFNNVALVAELDFLLNNFEQGIPRLEVDLDHTVEGVVTFPLEKVTFSVRIILLDPG